MKHSFLAIISLLVTMTVSAQYTLKDWNIEGVNETGTLRLNLNEYKLNYNHPLPYADWQKGWTIRVDLRCGTLGTEQVFICKEGKASHLMDRLSLHGDISIGYDNMQGQFFIEVIGKDEQPYRLCAGPKVEKDVGTP